MNVNGGFIGEQNGWVLSAEIHKPGKKTEKHN
jgi:hypothetical protein